MWKCTKDWLPLRAISLLSYPKSRYKVCLLMLILRLVQSSLQEFRCNHLANLSYRQSLQKFLLKKHSGARKHRNYLLNMHIEWLSHTFNLTILGALYHPFQQFIKFIEPPCKDGPIELMKNFYWINWRFCYHTKLSSTSVCLIRINMILGKWEKIQRVFFPIFSENKRYPQLLIKIPIPTWFI